jgi:hypothetical protein
MAAVSIAEGLVVGVVPNDDGVPEERALHATALDRQVDDPGDHDLACPGRIGFGLAGLDHGPHPLELGAGRGDHDLVLRLELVVHRRLRHADVVGDHLQRGPADAMLGEQLERGVDDPGLRGAVVLVPRAADTR